MTPTPSEFDPLAPLYAELMKLTFPAAAIHEAEPAELPTDSLQLHTAGQFTARNQPAPCGSSSAGLNQNEMNQTDTK